jgi:GAF domain-containing protein
MGMNEMALEQYKQTVEAQAQALLDAVQSVTLGIKDVEVPIPTEGEGIEILSELAIGLETMIGDLRVMTAEHEQGRNEIEKSRQELQAALDELLAVQRRYLREQWERYSETHKASRGYYRFGDDEGPTAEVWLPAMTQAVLQAEAKVEGDTEAELAIPIQLYGEMIGVLGLSRDGASPWTEEEIAVAGAIAEKVAEALDKQRLFDETRQALIETEKMYQASAELAEAQTYDDVLGILRAHTLLGRADHSTNLNLFDRPWVGNDTPEWIIPVARWSVVDADRVPRYALQDLASDLLHPDKPTIVADTTTDPRLKSDARALYVESYGIRTTVAVPLTVAGQWIGYADALFTEVTEFSEAEVRRLEVLAGQASIVLQNLRQLEETRSRAHRERILSEITARMRSFGDPEALAQTAVRELGTALGRPVFIRLGSTEQLSHPSSASATGNGDKWEERDDMQPPRRLNHARGVPAEGGE